MLTDPTARSSSAPSRRPARRSAALVAALAAAFVVVVLLRHDFWNWHTPRPLLLGVIPVGLWWQALVSILAALLMWLFVRFGWPEELEELSDRDPVQKKG